MRACVRDVGEHPKHLLGPTLALRQAQIAVGGGEQAMVRQGAQPGLAGRLGQERTQEAVEASRHGAVGEAARGLHAEYVAQRAQMPAAL